MAGQEHSPAIFLTLAPYGAPRVSPYKSICLRFLHEFLGVAGVLLMI
jgi:hypothetical protein